TLTSAEWRELSDGLAVALNRAEVHPRIRGRAHPAAHIAALWRGSTPIMAVGRTLWWPNAAGDFAGTPSMAVLQHELQHLLDYAEGRLSVAGYLLRPRNWTYDFDLSSALDWNALGAEQRASLAEALWRSERNGDAVTVARLRSLIPWARPASRESGRDDGGIPG
ncbi:MAG: hypothetical protein ACRED8_07435, partial [Caulobacteraceae bacterium]